MQLRARRGPCNNAILTGARLGVARATARARSATLVGAGAAAVTGDTVAAR